MFTSRFRNLGLAAALFIGLMIATVVMERNGPRRATPAPSPEPGTAAPAFATRPDLDGDGAPDRVEASMQGLTVFSGKTGARLLAFPAPIHGEVQVARLGGAYPVLFAPTAPDEYAAFTYDPGTGVMSAVTWPDGRMRGYGELTRDGSLKEAVVAGATRSRVVGLALDKLRLEPVTSVYQPLTESRKTPSAALQAAVEAVVLDLRDELPTHIPDADVADKLYKDWHGKLPAGKVVVAQADEVDAGAEHGHTIPVTVWIAGEREVVGLKGDAAFVSGPTGVQIRQLSLSAIPLKVRTWNDAAKAIMTRRQGSATQLERAPVPFYGRFRFVAGDQRYAVDAATGAVEDE